MLAMLMSIDACQFLDTIRPALVDHNPQLLAELVARRWNTRQICSLLDDPRVDVRRAAAMVMGLIGTLDDADPLTAALQDRDEQVNQMAEHALWSIWFRAGKKQATDAFRRGLSCLTAENYRHAIECFEQALAIDPHFAEACNQCAIAHYFLGQWDQAIADCRQTLERIPAHFGAILGMGHCFVHKGDLHEALACYRRGLRINPCLPAIARTIERLEGRHVYACDPVDQLVN